MFVDFILKFFRFSYVYVRRKMSCQIRFVFCYVRTLCTFECYDFTFFLLIKGRLYVFGLLSLLCLNTNFNRSLDDVEYFKFSCSLSFVAIVRTSDNTSFPPREHLKLIYLLVKISLKFRKPVISIYLRCEVKGYETYIRKFVMSVS